MLVISDEFLQSANITPAELLDEVAIYLYAKNKLSFGQARKLAGKDVLEFQELLYKNNIPVHYDLNELASDYKAIQSSLKK